MLDLVYFLVGAHGLVVMTSPLQETLLKKAFAEKG
tara:strand:+ start:306 stop:410 length:105 start_codon:yes stop_codon:yes gene_type:complete